MAERLGVRPEPQVIGLDHVQLAMPPGGEPQAREFYGDLLGLHEVEKPAQLADRGGCWFAGPAVHVHLGVEGEFRPARKAHPAFIVADLPAVSGRLTAAGIKVVIDDVDIGVSRCYVADPFGNRIELVAAEDGGFTDRQRPIANGR
ncbi:MAG: glyoxalase [Chloroflexota bacterium]|nr:glyoxalase [Chloroflexota bacterium]